MFKFKKLLNSNFSTAYIAYFPFIPFSFNLLQMFVHSCHVILQRTVRNQTGNL